MKNTTRFSWDLQKFRKNHKLTKAQFAERLGISKSYLEILESPQDYVPEPLPNHIADRLNDWQRALAGKVRKMPKQQCPLHNCPLRKVRGLGWLRREGQLERWWAKCVMWGELYIVRSDREVQLPYSASTGRHPKPEHEKQNFMIGTEVERARRDRFERFIEVKRSLPKSIRSKKDSLTRELLNKGFSKEEIKAGLRAKTAVIAARNFVVDAHFSDCNCPPNCRPIRKQDRRSKSHLNRCPARQNLQSSTVAKYHREYLKHRPPVPLP